MAKPIITDKPIIDEVTFEGITIWKKEGNTYEVSDTNFPSIKAALQDIAEKAGFEYDSKWTTQQFGSKLVSYLKKPQTNDVKDLLTEDKDTSNNDANCTQDSTIDELYELILVSVGDKPLILTSGIKKYFNIPLSEAYKIAHSVPVTLVSNLTKTAAEDAKSYFETNTEASVIVLKQNAISDAIKNCIDSLKEKIELLDRELSKIKSTRELVPIDTNLPDYSQQYIDSVNSIYKAAKQEDSKERKELLSWKDSEDVLKKYFYCRGALDYKFVQYDQSKKLMRQLADDTHFPLATFQAAYRADESSDIDYMFKAYHSYVGVEDDIPTLDYDFPKGKGKKSLASDIEYIQQKIKWADEIKRLSGMMSSMYRFTFCDTVDPVYIHYFDKSTKSEVYPISAYEKVFRSFYDTYFNKSQSSNDEMTKNLIASLKSENKKLVDDYNEVVKKYNDLLTITKSASSPKPSTVSTKVSVTDSDPQVDVKFSFKIKGFFGWERTSRIVSMRQSEYKALLRGSDKNRKSYIINHSKAFNFGLLQSLNVEGLDSVSIELD